jgi:predicted ArsR family transcriptional regulator
MTATGSTRARSGPATPQAMMRALTGLSAAQHTLLAEIARHPRPVTVAELADRMGLHPNSVREALAVLVDTGLVTRQRQPAPGRGRPSWAYQSVAPTQTAALSREFADMSAAVAEHLAASAADPAAAAHDIGARWGRRMVDMLVTPERGAGRDPAGRVDVHAGKVRLFLSSLGYQPLADDDPARIRLYQCPLRAEGQVPSPLVCQMHRGMLDEVLATLSDDRVGALLTPFAGPSYCTVELTPTPGPAARARARTRDSAPAPAGGARGRTGLDDEAAT